MRILILSLLVYVSLFGSFFGEISHAFSSGDSDGSTTSVEYPSFTFIYDSDKERYKPVPDIPIGKDVKVDDFQAVEVWRKACNNGDSNGCFNLGNMYYYGKGVRQDSIKAVQLFKKSCSSGNAWGCVDAGAMYDYILGAVGVKQNSKKALEFYGKACDMKFNVGCKNYATLKKDLGR